MKKATLIIGVLMIASLISFKPKRNNSVPPGTIKITDTFFADKTEVENVAWREYIHWLNRKFGEQSKEYLSALPDSSVWMNTSLTSIQKKYFRHREYANYPVVGISYQQAKAFCKWRSDRVNEAIYRRKNNISFHPDINIPYEKIDKIYEYRLPTKEEWRLIVSSNNSRYKNHSRRGLTTRHLSYPAQNPRSKKKEFCHLNSNVSELIEEKGTAMGGNWKNQDDKNGCGYKYEKATNWVGFRCVCDKKQK